MLKNLLVTVALSASFLFSAHSAHAQVLQKGVYAQPEREWTMLVFLNGHNDLDNYGYLNMNQMEEVGSNDKINLVVQWGSAKRTNDQRLLMTKDSDPDNVTSKVLMTLPSVDMGDVKSLEDFLTWGAANFPAKHYMVVVWNHGSGWHNLLSHRTQKFGIQNISYDDRTNNSITTPQLGEALTSFSAQIGRKIDIYGSDACLMQMAEVIGEMKDSVLFAVGSEELEPAQGWPYNEFLNRVIADGDWSAKKISTTLVEEYKKAYSPGGIYGNEQVTLSAVDMSAFVTLTDSLRSLVKEVTSSPQMNSKMLSDVINSSQQFYTTDYVDLGDFLDGLQVKMSSMRGKINAVNAIRSKAVIAYGNTSPYEKATGLAIWLPSDKYTLQQYEKEYRDLKFAQDSQWLDLLNVLN